MIYTLIGLVASGLLIWTYVLLIKKHSINKKAKQNPFAPDPTQVFNNIKSNIENCTTYADLINCHEWVKRNEFVLSPSMRVDLILAIREREQKMQDDLSEIMNYPVGKLQ